MKRRAVEVGMMDDGRRQAGTPVETESAFESEFAPLGGRRMPGAMYLRARERREREDAVLAVPVTPPALPTPPSRHPRTDSRGAHGRRRPGATIGAGLAATLVAALVTGFVATLAVTGAWTPGGRVAHRDTARQPAVTAGTAVVGMPASAAGRAPLPARAADRSPGPMPAQPPQLTITTTPAGAHVTVRDIEWGTTPLSIRYLPAGPALVRVTLDGYAPEELWLLLREGGAEAPRLHVSLVPSSARR